MGYDDWKMVNLREESYPTPEDFGYVLKSEIPDLEEVRAWYEEVLEHIFITGNLEKLVKALSELGSQLNVEPDFMSNDPVLTPKKVGKHA